MPNSSLNSRASSPMVMPCRIGIGNSPTNDSYPATSIGPSTAVPPMGFGRSHTIDREAVFLRGPEAVRHRVDVGVDPRADVLEIDDEDIDSREHRRWSAHAFRCTANRPAPGVPRPERDRSRSCFPARRSESRAAARRSPQACVPRRWQPVGDVPQVAVDRRGIADDADATRHSGWPKSQARRIPGKHACHGL